MQKFYRQHYTEQGNAETISSKIWSKIRTPQAPFLFDVILDVSVAPITQEEDMKCIRIGKEEDKCDMVLHTENSNTPSKGIRTDRWIQ